METQINQANIKAPVAVNQAQAKANSDLANNFAKNSAYYYVSETEAIAYKLLKDAMKIMNDNELLNLFKQMTLNGFNPKNRIISFA